MHIIQMELGVGYNKKNSKKISLLNLLYCFEFFFLILITKPVVFNASPKAIYIASCDTIQYKQTNSSCHSKRLELVEKKLKIDFNCRHSNIQAEVLFELKRR